MNLIQLYYVNRFVNIYQDNLYRVEEIRRVYSGALHKLIFSTWMEFKVGRHIVHHPYVEINRFKGSI